MDKRKSFQWIPGPVLWAFVLPPKVALYGLILGLSLYWAYMLIVTLKFWYRLGQESAQPT